jgi:tetratricopeptide (TPR) repeat protein
MVRTASYLITLLAVTLVISNADASNPQTAPVITDVAEYNAYMGAYQQPNPAAKISGLEAFLKHYPNSVMKNQALEILMGTYQQTGDLNKAVDAATELLTADTCNVRALTVAAYLDRAMAQGGDPNAKQLLADARKYGEQGIDCLPRFTKPNGTSDADVKKMTDQMAAIFNAAIGSAALSNKDYATARTALRAAVDGSPDSRKDFSLVYSLMLAYVAANPPDSKTPPDPVNALWFAARAAIVAPSPQSQEQIESYGKKLYAKYHGSDQGWADLLATAKNNDFPPQCDALDQVVQIEDAMPSGAGHCSGESDFWFTNTSAQAIDCAIIFHKNGRFDPPSVLTFTLSPGEKSGGTGKISTCGADSGEMQYQCFPHAEKAAANSCTAQIQWQP